MSVVTDVLRPYWLYGLNEVSGVQTTSLKAWMSDAQIFFDVSKFHASLKKEFTFIVINYDSLINSFAVDINKMAAAAFESVQGIPGSQEIQRSTAWTAIRAYYSSFFSAHVLTRLFGVAVVQLEPYQITPLNRAISEAGESFSLGEGLYRLEVISADRSFTLKKLGNSHLDTWKEFGGKVNSITDDILSGAKPITPETRDTTALLLRLLAILKTPPCHTAYNWLSYMRNELNYRLMHDVWFPHSKSSRFREGLETYVQGWRRDPISFHIEETETMIRYGLGCVIPVSIMHSLVLDMAIRNPHEDSFLKDKALKVLNQCA